MEGKLLVKILVILMIFNLGLTFYLVTQLTDITEDVTSLKTKIENQNIIEIPGVLESKDVVFEDITATGLVEQMELSLEEVEDKYEVEFDVYDPDEVTWCGDGRIEKVLYTADPEGENRVIRKTGYTIALRSSNCEDGLDDIFMTIPYPEGFRCNQASFAENIDQILESTNNTRLVGIMEYEAGEYVHEVEDLDNQLNKTVYRVSCDNDSELITLEAVKTTEWEPE